MGDLREQTFGINELGVQPYHPDVSLTDEQVTRISMLANIAPASLLVAALALAGCTDTILRGVNPNAEKQLPQRSLPR